MGPAALTRTRLARWHRSPRRRALGAPCLIALAAGALLACGDAPSALRPAGRDAERIAELTWIMLAGAVVVWALVIAAALYTVLRRHRTHTVRQARWFIVGGGVVLPTVTLAALLTVGLAVLPDLLDLGPDGQPVARVVGERWWWRVRQPLPDGTSVELANELRLPVGRRGAIAVESADVVHSLWVPALAGKVDAIPGRTTWLGVEPTRAGAYRGICAEYCGLSHAHMLLSVVAMPPDAFARWLDHQATPARPARSEPARRGEHLFLATGCGACHAVRGTPAEGASGPDLTHVGSRRTIAGILDNDVEGFRRWLVDTPHLKPGALMPAFDMLPPEDVDALAAYLEGLQ
ncbi:MAG: c-type cytochrome [Myxococcales bacterium]|nr:c-type cytochrome [Myxococcales bacterium]